MQIISVHELVSRYSRELVRLNYTKNTRKNYEVFWNQLISYFESKEQSVFSEGIAIQFLEDRYRLSEVLRRGLTRNETSVRQMVRKVVLFHRHGAVRRASRVPLRNIRSEKLLDVLAEYDETCRRRGYAKGTRRNLQHYAVRFFMHLESRSISELSQVTAQSVTDYVNSFGAQAYRSIGLHLTCLRNVLAFLQEGGHHPQDLSAAVPKQQVRRDATVPSIWSQENVVALLGAIDRGSPCGRRDYAIMLLVARLGLRAGDVRNLKLENLQWSTSQIEFIQTKTSKRVSLPLLKDVGWAIIEYLKHGRPASDSPFVFLSHIAPHQKLGEGNCFYHIIRRSASVANLIASVEQRMGMHSLRHSLATTLLEKHTPLSTIAGVLGHASMESSAVYLKADVTRLRECALESPGGGEMNGDTLRTPFAHHVEGLILQKHALGYRYDTQAAILKRFDRFCLRYHANEMTLSKKIVTHWAERQPGESIGSLRIRASAVRQLAIYLGKLGAEAYVIPSGTLPKYAGYIPYIFTNRELDALFCRVDACSPGGGSDLRHLVLPLLFRLLYCCGLRVSEATHLRVRDVDLKEGILTIRKAKFGKERQVPMSQNILGRARAYSERVGSAVAAQDSVFLPSPSGKELSTNTVYGNFRTFLWEAGISHGGPGKGPRVHDLRHTYAVHCLKRWVQEDKDLSAYLPLLTAYFGHIHFRETSYYLRLTADLYPTITAQVERAFGEIVPETGGLR